MRKLLMLSAAAVFAAGQAHAGPLVEDTAPEATRLPPVTVLATRTERRVDDAPATVSVITADEIETMLATDIKDLIRYEPGVSVPTSPARFSAALSGAGRDGNSGFTIRGLGGNRVLIISDGVRLPDGFSFGAQSVGRGGYNDLDLIKSVEILRGPASALYGSDGVAGAVSFTSKDPGDFIEAGRAFGARVRLGYGSADDGWSEGLALAGRSGAISGLLAYNRRDAHETENQGQVGGTGSSRTEPNPQDFSSNAVLGKLLWDINDRHSLRLTYDHFDQTMDGEALSSLSASVLQVSARDETERDRVSLEWRFDHAFGLDGGRVSAYAQDATTRQFTYEDRTPAVDRTRDVTFDNRVVGLAAQGHRSFRSGRLRHRLTLGADYSQTRQEGIRDGTVPPVGETFPTRAFPNTDYALAGLYVQDEIALLDGRLSVIPALRYDWYELTPKPDALFTAASAGQSDDHLSPKLGVVFWADDRFGLFANYAVGFKAPSPGQVNNYFANPVFGYASIPNPDLTPETSTSFEAGLRLRDLDVFGGTLALQTTAYSAHYDDFIDQVVVGGGFTPADPAIFQYVNLTEVDIRGVEARGRLDWDNGLGLTVAAAWAEGDQTTAGTRTELGSVDPLKLVAGLSHAEPQGRYGTAVTVTWSDAKPDATYSLSCGAGCYLGDSVTLVDLTAWWSVTGRATLRAGVFNLFDQSYGWWSDVRGLSAGSTVRDAYTQPGRNVGLSLAVRL
tara:strand:- start:526 stop:2721 length:2196 start_codon:yes stop_codon:yes gene_type:complete